MTAPLQPHAATPQSLSDYVAEMRPRVESSLRRHLPLTPAQFETPYNEALEYALFPGGKRLRPVLTLLGAELVGGRAEEVLDAAVAVEFIHTSSLVFDDLPCMDDARERRGREPLHRRYGDGVAILVALGLLNAAYGIVLDAAPSEPGRARAAHAEIVECIGPRGMVGGQAIDLAGARAGSGAFDAARNLKTSASDKARRQPRRNPLRRGRASTRRARARRGTARQRLPDTRRSARPRRRLRDSGHDARRRPHARARTHRVAGGRGQAASRARVRRRPRRRTPARTGRLHRQTPRLKPQRHFGYSFKGSVEALYSSSANCGTGVGS